jgi:CRISPR-associated protein Cas1
VIKRTVEISQRAVHVTVRQEQLLLLPRGDVGERPGSTSETPARDGAAALASIPCEDLGLLVVDQPATTYAHAALAKLLECGAAVVICGTKHLPAGLLLPLAEHTEVVWRVQDQLALGKPLRKQLWRQLVQAKVRAQAANLPAESPIRTRLLGLARSVRSGDPTNIEAQAARAYWTAYFGPLFRRDQDGDGINALLNYGYAILRAAVARAIVSAGLQPALGLHHENRSNAFCLADDLLEPLRPGVDACVASLAQAGRTELVPPAKAELLKCMTAEVRLSDQTGPLLVALHRYVASYVRCLAGEARRLDIPTLLRPPPTLPPQEGGARVSEFS